MQEWPGRKVVKCPHNGNISWCAISSPHYLILSYHTLPLKHATWVQKELEILEKAGVIVRSVSPWASPIVIVPKRTAPGETPKRGLCMDY